MKLFFVATLTPAAFALLAISDVTSGPLGGSRGSGRSCWRERLWSADPDLSAVLAPASPSPEPPLAIACETPPAASRLVITGKWTPSPDEFSGSLHLIFKCS